jgi:hypothetical protein
LELEKTHESLGFIVWALMQSIGEVTTMFPIAGGFIEVCFFIQVYMFALFTEIFSMLDGLSILHSASQWLGCITSCGPCFLEAVSVPHIPPPSRMTCSLNYLRMEWGHIDSPILGS